MKLGAEVEQLRFEEALKQLEAIVSRLEVGDLPLEEALSIFEEGIRLTKLCSQRLYDLQARMTGVMRSRLHALMVRMTGWTVICGCSIRWSGSARSAVT